MSAGLRLFTDLDTEPLPEQVTMTVGEFSRILGDAGDCDRTWLLDFEHDEIQVPADLFVVMQAYWNMRSAA